MKFPAMSAFVMLSALASPAFAGPLREARIHQIVNDVKVVEPRQGVRAAVLQDVVKDDLGVATGVQSRAELLFQDRTLTRLGAETFFSFQPGTRDLKLERGSMLLQVPKNLGGARIRAASVTASITGTTIMVENLPGKAVKIVVLEGSLNVAIAGKSSEPVQLRAGKMMTVTPETRKLPRPVDVDLRKLVRTSVLIDPAAFKGSSKAAIAALPSMPLIEKEIASQDSRLKSSGATAFPFTATGERVAAATDSPQTLATILRDAPPEVPSPEPATAQIQPETAVGVPSRDVVPATVAAGNPGQRTSTSGTDPAATTELLVAGDVQIGLGQDAHATTAGGALRNAGVSASPADPSATNSGSPGTGSATARPAVIATPAPYVIDSGTTIFTAGTTLATDGVAVAGGLYRSAEVTGAASAYLFTAPSTFDTASGLDAKFSIMSGGRRPSEGVAVYRFAGLDLQRSPTFTTTNGPIDLALVSQSSITSSSSGSAWKVDGLGSLFFGTENGPVALNQEIKTTSLSSTFKYLQAYARGGAGSVTLAGKISTPLASLYIDAEQGITVTETGSILARSTIFNTPGSIEIDKSPVSATLKLTAGTGIRFTKSLASGNVQMTAPILQTSGDLWALTGFLEIGAGGIQAGGAKLGGFDHIAVIGDVEAGTVSVDQALDIGGTFRTGASSGQATLSAGTYAIGGGIDLTGAASGAGGTVTLYGTEVNVGSAGIKGIKADGQDGSLTLAAGGKGGTVNVGTSANPIAHSITVEKPISATTGANAAGVLHGGAGGTVNLIAKGAIAVNSTVKVSESALTRASTKGGAITLASRKTTGTAITVNNSGQLLALLSAAAPGAGGTIKFVSSGGDIVVDGGTVQADRGTADIRNHGAGNISLTNAAIRGDVVKVGALGANGQLLIGGGTISADTSLKLYGGISDGQVRFTDNVTLGGNGAKAIAGKTVTIDHGKTVTVGGQAAKVYTDRANYTGSGGNGSTSGTFGGAGARTQPFRQRPAF